MRLKRASQWLNYSALIAIITISALLMCFLLEIYRIIDVLLYACLGGIIALSVLALVIGLRVNKNEGHGPAKPNQPLVQPQLVTQITEEQDTNITYNSCPNCKKIFSKPIVMLNFERKKTKLVNVCPHCNHMLGDAENKDPRQNML